MKSDDIIKKVSKDLAIPEIVVKEVLESYWLFIRDTIKNLNLEKVNSLDGLKTNFNIYNIGKLNLTESRLKGLRKRYKYLFNKEIEVEDEYKED